MKTTLYLLLCSMFIVFSAQSSTARLWKNSEEKQASNREADVKKRLINHEVLLTNAKDSEIRSIYENRRSLLQGCQADIQQWKSRIAKNDKLNSKRYNLLTYTKLRKAETMQMLITLRTGEIAYELFGGEFKAEALEALTSLRKEINTGIDSFDQTLSSISANIQQLYKKSIKNGSVV